MRVQDAVGKYGEALAAGRLAADGLVVLDTNWRCREGEIDLVARDGDALVVVEVKTRSGAGYGGAAGAVTPAKQRRLRRLAVRWLADHPGTGWETSASTSSQSRAAAVRSMCSTCAEPSDGPGPYRLRRPARGRGAPGRGRGRPVGGAARARPHRYAGRVALRGARPGAGGRAEQRPAVAQPADHGRPVSRGAAQVGDGLRRRRRGRGPGGAGPGPGRVADRPRAARGAGARRPAAAASRGAAGRHRRCRRRLHAGHRPGGERDRGRARPRGRHRGGGQPAGARRLPARRAGAARAGGAVRRGAGARGAARPCRRRRAG